MTDSKDKNIASSGPPVAFIKGLKRLLKPLIRAMIAQRLTYPALQELLKRTYVEVVKEGFHSNNKPLTASRISVMTGVHRKDVKKLREEEISEFKPPENVSIGARAIGLWTGYARYLDANGKPRPLSIKTDFEELIEAISKDVRPRTVLDEWLRLGIVETDEDDMLHLKTSAFIPRDGFDEIAYYYGRNLHDHIASATHNLLGESPARLDRSVYYNKLTPESVKILSQRSEELSMEVLQTLSKEARKLVEKDRGKDNASQRMNFGVYFYEEEEGDT